MFGPYLRAWPENPVNGRRSIRIDGAPAGANTHGWRVDSATGRIESDVPAGGPPVTRVVEGDMFNVVVDAGAVTEDQ
jgi:hypothetical protein